MTHASSHARTSRDAVSDGMQARAPRALSNGFSRSTARLAGSRARRWRRSFGPFLSRMREKQAPNPPLHLPAAGFSRAGVPARPHRRSIARGRSLAAIRRARRRRLREARRENRREASHAPVHALPSDGTQQCVVQSSRLGGVRSSVPGRIRGNASQFLPISPAHPQSHPTR